MTQNTEATAADIENHDDADDELSHLKERARLLGIRFSPSIKAETLRDRINAALTDEPAEAAAKVEEPAAPAEAAAKVEEPAAPAAPLSPLAQKAALRKKLIKEEMKLVRLRITNMNPHKKDLHGEIFTVANKYLGIVKKYVPYGEATDEGYHVPYIIYRQLKDRKFLQIKTRKDPKNTGQILVDQRWVNEFAIEVLPQLTAAELAELKALQMASAGLR